MSSINLPTALTIQTASADHKFLSDMLDSLQAPAQLEASAIAEIDTAGMQLLLALVNELNSRSLKPVWHSPSEILIQTAATLGMSEALALPTAA